MTKEAIESRYDDVEVSPTFKSEAASNLMESPAGDYSLDFLDKHFTVLEHWLDTSLKDGPIKTVAIKQLPFFYFLLRTAVSKALT